MFETEFKKRRTFAIISHPDAGKTTLTEKLLLFGGAIQMAGEVKAKKERMSARSDWMKVEQERGISVASSVMTFEYGDCIFNLLDTPGHQDFSEDTYRVLSAVDSAVMVLDAAKGIERQTQKLFEVCRLRNIPIITFINKMDRDGQSPFALLDEIEKKLALEVVPLTWPIGMGREFLGCFNFLTDSLNLFAKNTKADGKVFKGVNDTALAEFIPEDKQTQLKEDAEMITGLCPKFSQESYLHGFQTPVFFGSAINNFGVRELLDAICSIAPAPLALETKTRTIQPSEEKVSAFVFKIQANMDPKHRDRIAFARICSGHFTKGMKLKNLRLDKNIVVSNPLVFLAAQRNAAEEAYAGDIVGILNHGNFAIGDGLSEGENLTFKGIPSFAPEILTRVRPRDPLKSKHLGEALMQIAQEGGASVFKMDLAGDYVVGAIGQLQLEVMADRFKNEFNIEVISEPAPFTYARWVYGAVVDLQKFGREYGANLGKDHLNNTIFLARNSWQLQKAGEDYSNLKFTQIREQN
jgi:peptide chain release factor 3